MLQTRWCSLPNVLRTKVIQCASSGIGKGAALHFAKLGCSLSLTGRDEAALQITKQKCIENGLEEKNVIYIVADLTQEDGAKIVITKTLEYFAKLNILVNAAGIVLTGMVESTALDSYDTVMNINCRSIVMLTQLCISHLIKTKGSIVNVSSINGICSFPNVTFYCMSKAALDQFTKCLALEMAPHQVRVNSVNPGVIITDVHKRGGMNEEQYKKFLEHSKSTHALGRVGDVEEVAKSIAFLASDDASFTTGQLLKIDGGRGLMTPR